MSGVEYDQRSLDESPFRNPRVQLKFSLKILHSKAYANPCSMPAFRALDRRISVAFSCLLGSYFRVPECPKEST